MKIIMRIAAIAAVLLLVGCAHPISMAPKMSVFDDKQPTQKISKNIGYYISVDDRAREVTTPGGSGDTVRYFPYKDLEPGLYKMLSNSFNDVYVVKSLDDRTFLTERKIAYVLIPKIETTSSSSSAFTWPPTDFIVSLECRAISLAGDVVWKTTAKGEGRATFSEFKSDFSLSARRASEQALLQLQKQIGESPLAR